MSLFVLKILDMCPYHHFISLIYFVFILKIPLQAKDKSARECNALRSRTAELEDKTSYLSTKLKEMDKELQSSNAYIDKLYAELQTHSNLSPSKEMRAQFERKEMDWLETERGYSKRIQELEGHLQGLEESREQKVSMEAYMSVVKQTRHYKNELMKNQQTMVELKGRLEALQRSQVSNGGETSMQGVQGSSQNAKKQKEQPKQQTLNVGALQSTQPKQFVQRNNENTAPSVSNQNAHQQANNQKVMSAKQAQRGNQINRAAVIKAAGGRKGLARQLKRARRFGEKPVAQNVV